MTSLDERSVLELEDKTLVTPVSPARKSHPLDVIQHGSFSGSPQASKNIYMRNRVLKNLKIVLLSSKINLLLPFGPLAILVNYLTGRHGWVFFLTLLGIIPLAERLGYATEQLAFYTGPTVGGLLNATFGNATELLISIFALKNGMVRVVQQSLLGSILSNMLLVLGCAFLSGGIVHCKKDQVFNKGVIQTENSYDNEDAEISKWESIIWLSILTAWISVLSGYLVDAIEGASIAWNIPIAFISVILLPIVGNASEHASAIMFAMKDKLDISLGVAIGSSTQISMFGIPFCVVVGWLMGRPMDLNFQLFETTTLFVMVLVVAFLLQEGTSNYFKGLMLILCYLIVAASFFVHADPKSVADKIHKN
ncbi:PREDICTED: vacuolar cation/proton exchanger 2-like isoform X6 [Nelumbo nucifera]|uniref:Vacuolar cation/proton exchanger 2-like isoform X6 n=1 Tax=Nelumbo nucifera TaxID=4432 RepID=A0A1U7ZIS7_NELNU|nr:PREDICTED: vacuolar cation/proton exchanger 2-like isoform X6 [Nelumbo nucifera]